MALPFLNLVLVCVCLLVPAEEPKAEGTVWAGQDSNGRAYVFRYLKGGAFSYTAPEGTFTNGAWKQDGAKLTWDVNNKFVEYVATINGDKLTGEAVNTQGVKKTFTFKRQAAEGAKPAPTRPAAPSVAGTAWTGTTKDDLPLVLRFQKDGKLEYMLEGKTFREGNWRQNSDLVMFDVNFKSAEYEGTLKGDELAGKAKNLAGDLWDWKVKKGEAAKPAPTLPATKPAETKPQPVETKPLPVETKPQPVETKPLPVETKPATPATRPSVPAPTEPFTLPAATKPSVPAATQYLPVETKPAETKPAERPTFTRPADTKPRLAETKPADPRPSRPTFTLPKLIDSKPEATKPTEPRPGEAPSGGLALAGSSWIGKDADGETFFIRLEKDGTGESQRGGRTTKDVAWRLTGDSLEFEMNRGWSKYAGVVLGRNRIEGTSTNKGGKEWSWTLTRVTHDTDLGGTTWSGVDSDRDKFSFSFMDDGSVEFVRDSGVMRKAAWRVVGSKVVIEVNGKFSTYEGTIKGDVMEGKASNVNGKKWTWKVTKQKQ